MKKNRPNSPQTAKVLMLSPRSSLANTYDLYTICTMLDQRRRRWADVVQMVCKCFVFAGSESQNRKMY